VLSLELSSLPDNSSPSVLGTPEHGVAAAQHSRWYLGEEMKAGGQVLLPHLLLGGRCLSLPGISLGQTAKESPFWRGPEFLRFGVFEFHPNLHTRFALAESSIQSHQLARCLP